ncbi:MAG: hypothetical protein ACK446_12570, partial [Rhodobacterales bacterium]
GVRVPGGGQAGGQQPRPRNQPGPDQNPSPPGADGAPALVRGGLYLFLVWAGLIAVARLLAPSLTADGHPDPDGGDG